jgi:hypothetical protein
LVRRSPGAPEPLHPAHRLFADLLTTTEAANQTLYREFGRRL